MAVQYKAFTKLFIQCEGSGERGSYGAGLIALLRGVRESGSLNKAAKNMHMAYSKAWKLMNSAEEEFGTALIERDGARGSTLTEEGLRLIESFDAVDREVNEFANRRLREVLAQGR